MLVGDVVCEVDGLAGVLVLEPLVDDWPVLERDEKARPPNPGEGEGLFAAAEGGDEAARGHLEVVLAVRILGDGDGEAVGYDDEVLGCAEVHVVWEIGLGVCAGRRGRTDGLRLVCHGRSFSAVFSRFRRRACTGKRGSEGFEFQRPIRAIRAIRAIEQRENVGS